MQKKGGVSGRPTLCTMIACARLSRKRVSQPWSSRISLPDSGKKTNDQITMVICRIRAVSKRCKYNIATTRFGERWRVQENLGEGNI